jgi:hypothetical protein
VRWISGIQVTPRKKKKEAWAERPASVEHAEQSEYRSREYQRKNFCFIL